MSFPKNVLLIDDDPEDCEIFFTALKERFDWVECNYEQDAHAALKRIYDATIPAPQMVFLDWRMPLISGAEILTIIRELPHYNDCYFYRRISQLLGRSTKVRSIISPG